MLQFQRANAVDIDDGRTVDADKLVRPQLLLKVRQTASDYMGFVADMEAGIIAGGLDPIDVGDIDEQDPAREI